MAKKSANRQGAIHFFCAKFPPVKLFIHWNEYLNTWRKKQHKYVKQFGGNELSTKEEANVNEGVLSNGGIQVVFQNLTSLLGLSLCMKITYGGGGSRPSDKGGGEGREVSSRPWDNGGPAFNFFFGPLTSVLSKNKGEGGPPRPLPWIRHWPLPILLVTCGTQGLKCLRIPREEMTAVVPDNPANISK